MSKVNDGTEIKSAIICCRIRFRPSSWRRRRRWWWRWWRWWRRDDPDMKYVDEKNEWETALDKQVYGYSKRARMSLSLSSFSLARSFFKEIQLKVIFVFMLFFLYFFFSFILFACVNLYARDDRDIEYICWVVAAAVTSQYRYIFIWR